MANGKRILLASTAAILAGVSMPAIAQDVPATTATGDKDIVVTGIRRSLQDSVETKRRSNAIVDVISAEGVGKFPDTNVAESLSHLPGVTVDHQFGEGEQVSINGVEPALNRILIDGHSIASADWGGNPSDRSSRSFNYSLLSPEIISQAIVYKTPEARIQEGAIGATVDIVTRKPLDLPPNTFRVSGGYEYNDRSNRGSPRGAVLYSWHNDSDTFGVLGSVSFDREYLARAGVAIYGYTTGAGLLGSYPTDANGNIVYGANGNTTGGATINGAPANRTSIATLSTARLPAFFAHEYFQQTRQREGFSGAIQWKPATNLKLTATGLIIRGKYDNLSNSEFSYNVRGNLLQAATVTNGLITSATFGPGTGSTWQGELDTIYRKTTVKNDSGTLAFDWNVSGWDVTGNGGYTKASGGKSPEYNLGFRTLQGFTVGANGRDTFLNWQHPASDATQWVTTAPAENGLQTEPAVLAATNGLGYTGSQIGYQATDGVTTDQEKFGQIDFARSVDFGPIAKIMFGLRYQDHDNQQVSIGQATFSNTGTTLAAIGAYTLDSGLYDGLSTTGNATPYATITPAQIISTLNASNTLNVNRGLNTDSFFKVNERIATAYVQADFETGKFRGNIGGRFVQTIDDSNYYLTSTVAAPTTANPNATRTTVAPFDVTHTDNRFLPAFNIAYDAGSTVVLRAAAAKVIARPRYSQLAGALSLDDTMATGSGGNPNLKPYAATNFGASAEWYFAPGALLSGEIFYRDISNYITNSNTQQTITNQSSGRTLTYAVSLPVNGGKASVTGFSITAQTSLKWGFGIQTNYTFADADTGLNGQGLPYLSRNTINIIPYYEKGPFQARVSYNRRSKYFYAFGRLSLADYTDAYRQMDFSASVKLTKAITVTANASNLLDETYYQYSQTPNAPTDLYKNGRVFSLNASFKM